MAAVGLLGRGHGRGQPLLDPVARVGAGAAERVFQRLDARGGVGARLGVDRKLGLHGFEIANDAGNPLILHLQPAHQQLGADAGRGRLVHLGAQRLHFHHQLVEGRVRAVGLAGRHAGQRQRGEAERPRRAGVEQFRERCVQHDWPSSSAIKRRT